MNIVERLLDFWLQKKVIHNCEHEPYLHRWYLVRTKFFAIFIHKFVRSDEDRALHDHPWPFLVIPIWRGYIEWHNCRVCKVHPPRDDGGACTNPESKRVYPILGARFRPATYRHRVELLQPPYALRWTLEKPAWSIFIRFRECREWGFWMPQGWKKWNQWWQENCE